MLARCNATLISTLIVCFSFQSSTSSSSTAEWKTMQMSPGLSTYTLRECSPRLETARCHNNMRCFRAFHTWDEQRRRQIELIQFKYSQHPCQRCIGMRMPELEALAVVNMGFNWNDKIAREREKNMIESSPSRRSDRGATRGNVFNCCWLLSHFCGHVHRWSFAVRV